MIDRDALVKRLRELISRDRSEIAGRLLASNGDYQKFNDICDLAIDMLTAPADATVSHWCRTRADGETEFCTEPEFCNPADGWIPCYTQPPHQQDARSATEYADVPMGPVGATYIGDTLLPAPAEAPVADDGSRFVSIRVDGSTHTRTADEWLALARADLSPRQQDARSVREAVIEECAKACEGEALVDNPNDSTDRAYNHAIEHAAAAIRALAPHPAEPAGKEAENG